jgi:mRNA-degrading endonuclease RelE of RelBE toxin-antitoxin system
MTKRVVISPQVKDFIRRLSPEPRKKARRCLDDLAVDRGDIRPLDENLEGYSRLRVGQYRIILEYLPRGEILCIFMETRASVYQLFAEARDLIDSV